MDYRYKAKPRRLGREIRASTSGLVSSINSYKVELTGDVMGDVIRMPTTDNTRGWNTEDGYIMLARGLYKNSKTWQNLNPVQKVVMVTLLMMANHKDNKWWDGNKFITVKRGQLVTSLNNLVSACGKGVSIKNIRTSLEKLEKMGFLANQSAKQYRLITIVNYDVYQSPDNYLANQSAKHRQSTGKAVATNKNGKKDNNIYSIFEHWNSKGIIVHKKLSEQMQKHINARLQDYTPEEIRDAIDNYAMVLHGEEYFWTYKWTLGQFLTRENGLEKFLSKNEPLANFLKSEYRSQEKPKQSEPEPAAEEDWQVKRMREKRLEREKNGGGKSAPT